MSKEKIIINLFLLFGLIACAQNREAENTDKIKVTVTILPMADIVKNIGGDKILVNVLVPPGSNPETYEPTIKELKELSKSKIYFKIGSGLPIEDVLVQKSKSLNKNLIIVDCSNDVSLIKNNPHIWLGLDEVKIISENVCDQLSQSFPSDRLLYEKNKINFFRMVDSTDNIIQAQITNTRKKEFLVYHPAWGYFAKKYGLTEIAIENEGKTPSAHELVQFINSAKGKNIKAIFVEPQFDKTTAQAIADEINAKLVELNPLPSNILSNFIDVSNKLELYSK